MFRILRPLLTKTNSTKELANKLLNEQKAEFERTNFPLKNTALKTVRDVSDTINGVKPANANTIKNAGLLDEPTSGNPIVKTLIKMGVQYNKKDIEFIRAAGNKSAADMLQTNLSNQNKPKF